MLDRTLKRNLNDYTISEWYDKIDKNGKRYFGTFIDNTENAEIGTNGYEVKYYPLTKKIEGTFWNETRNITFKHKFKEDVISAIIIREWIENHQIFNN